MKFLFLILLAIPAFADEDIVARERIVALTNHVTEVNKRVDQRFEAEERSRIQTAQALEKRLDSVNEFRGQLKDQAAGFVTRSELWGYLIGLIGLVGSVVAIVIHIVNKK